MLDSGDPHFSGRFHARATASLGDWSCTSLAVAICQPWFYLRLAPRRGTIALLGYPREHMVARETWRQWRTQPNPPRILTLEPELAAHLEKRGVNPGLSCGPARSSGLRLQIFGVERFSFLPHMQSDGGNLARQGQPGQLGLHPLPQEVFVERAKGSVAAAGA